MSRSNRCICETFGNGVVSGNGGYLEYDPDCPKHGGGGLVALTLADVERLLSWCTAAQLRNRLSVEERELRDRLREWMARHTEATP